MDNFGVKCVYKKHTDHLIATLQKHYASVTEDWEGKLYVGITLDWNYKEKWLDTSMPGYIDKVWQHFKHKISKLTQHDPYRAAPKA